MKDVIAIVLLRDTPLPYREHCDREECEHHGEDGDRVRVWDVNVRRHTQLSVRETFEKWCYSCITRASHIGDYTPPLLQISPYFLHVQIMQEIGRDGSVSTVSKLGVCQHQDHKGITEREMLNKVRLEFVYANQYHAIQVVEEYWCRACVDRRCAERASA